MKNRKYKLINLIYIFVLLSFPLSIRAQNQNVDVVLGNFFNQTLGSLVFKPTQNIYIFKSSSIGNIGSTVVPNPFKNLKPLGPLNFIQIPADTLINLSNFVFKEVNR